MNLVITIGVLSLIITLIIILILPIPKQLQPKQQPSHLIFNGIDVSNGTEYFVNKLIELGFKKLTIMDTMFLDDKILQFSGIYLNKNVKLYVVTIPNSNLISFVSVVFNEYKSYDEAKNDSVLIFNKLTEKHEVNNNLNIKEIILDYISNINKFKLLDFIYVNHIISSEQGILLDLHSLSKSNVLTFIDPINFKIGVDEMNAIKKKSELDLTNL